MVEHYQQFLLKLVTAYKNLEIDRPWFVYENSLTSVRNTREYTFIRGMSSWSDLDTISQEKSLSEIMAESFGDNEAMQWMKIVQRAVKKVSTSVLSQIPSLVGKK